MKQRKEVNNIVVQDTPKPKRFYSRNNFEVSCFKILKVKYVEGVRVLELAKKPEWVQIFHKALDAKNLLEDLRREER